MPNKENDGVVIDGGVGLLDGERLRGDHQGRADDRGAGAVHTEARQTADGQHQVGQQEDDDSGQQGSELS
jgi:hypothetical protein